MQSGKTDADGHFSLEGDASDLIGDIDPRLRIYDGCNKDLTQVCRYFLTIVALKIVNDTKKFA